MIVFLSLDKDNFLNPFPFLFTKEEDEKLKNSQNPA
jgi:hypothetical protein